MNKEAVTTNQVNLWPRERREIFNEELVELYTQAFPKMPENQRKLFIEDYFKQPISNLTRETLLFRDEAEKLVAAAVFDRGNIRHAETTAKGIYSISRAVLPAYQGYGLGKTIAKNIFTDYTPDILFTTCAQSASLHSWIGLCSKGEINGYVVYPRLEEDNGLQKLICLRVEDIDFAINAFKQVYMGVADGNEDVVSESAGSLTVQLVRKNIYEVLYNHEPWQKRRRKDKLAMALKLTRRDGVLVIFKKSELFIR